MQQTWIKRENLSEFNQVISKREKSKYFYDSGDLTLKTSWGGGCLYKTGKLHTEDGRINNYCQGVTQITNLVFDMKYCYWIIKN